MLLVFLNMKLGIPMIELIVLRALPSTFAAQEFTYSSYPHIFKNLDETLIWGTTRC